MHFSKVITALAGFAVVGLALPKAGPPKFSSALRTIKNDIKVLEDSVTKSGNALLSAITSGTGAEVHIKIEANLKAIHDAALKAGYGVKGDIADVPKKLSAAAAKRLKKDASLLAQTAGKLSSMLREVEKSELGASVAILREQKASIVNAVDKIAQPLTHFVGEATGIGGENADRAVADLRHTVHGLLGNLKSLFGPN